ncbi:MAG: hypothetical protein HY023_10560 [Chloroflexi bacterium]|nr:hypothetical protein [Chloroflexota bacterium]MBI3760609.1 hypothetical protein [Chloroflexota bacterium]
MDDTQTTLTPDRPFRIPTIAWVAAGGLVAALVAIFVFKVAAGTVLIYGLFGLMALSHLFMHGGHGSHGGHAGHNADGQRQLSATDADGPTNAAQSKDEHAGHSGGCC